MKLTRTFSKRASADLMPLKEPCPTRECCLTWNHLGPHRFPDGRPFTWAALYHKGRTEPLIYNVHGEARPTPMGLSVIPRAINGIGPFVDELTLEIEGLVLVDVAGPCVVHMDTLNGHSTCRGIHYDPHPDPARCWNQALMGLLPAFWRPIIRRTDWERLKEDDESTARPV